MALPKIAIVGRPNVGKSTLFNALARRRIAIEDAAAGITRDRISTRIDFADRAAEVIDTGGIGLIDSDNLAEDVEIQIDIAMREADIILFLVDVRDEVTPLDKSIADRIRRLEKPVIFIANKADTPKLADLAGVFAALGFGDALAISAKEKKGLDTLRGIVEEALLDFPEPKETDEEQPLKLAIVGKRNAGKSTLVNHLAGEVRVIVSEVAGTTRDSVDVPFEFEGRRYLAIDTAGLRKARSVRANVDYYSVHRTQRSIRHADVTVFLVDCTQKISQVDKKLASYVVAEKKPVIIALNKYDLARHIEPEAFRKYVDSQLTGVAFAPMVFVSALTGFKVGALLGVARDLKTQANYRATTGDLNRLMESIYQRRRPKAYAGRVPKIYYATQSGVLPPTIVLFVSSPRAFSSNYVRYVENSLRKELPFKEVPLKVVFRASAGSESGAKS